ncbi:unnamed protein product [Effrenium voratum]|nr:unnamed protein product [Effrenium voratum]
MALWGLNAGASSFERSCSDLFEYCCQNHDEQQWDQVQGLGREVVLDTSCTKSIAHNILVLMDVMFSHRWLMLQNGLTPACECQCLRVISVASNQARHDALAGTGHWGPVDPGKEKIAEEDGSAPTYEWGCPFQGEWTENRYESGPGDDQCTDERDCICIARGSPDMHTELEGGHEKIIGRFETESDKANLGHEPQLIHVIPHYYMRTKDGAPFDIDNPHSGLGTVKEFDREEWLLKYKEEAPKMQSALDKLRATIDAEYHAKVQSGAPFVCDGAQAAGQEPSLTKAETQLNLMRIRRFQVLASDCVTMRDTAAKVSGKPDQEGFAPSGKAEGGEELKCYKKKDSTECQQLNCYHGFEDQGFLERLQLFKTQLDTCRPEQDTPLAGVDTAGADAGIKEAEKMPEKTENAAEAEKTAEDAAEEAQAEGATTAEIQPGPAGKEQSMGHSAFLAACCQKDDRGRSGDFL